MKALPAAFVVIVAALSGVACSPTRSSLRPPYELRGKQLDEAQIRQLAAEQCGTTGPESPDHPFTTDGCSLWPDGSWRSCCLEHDLVYWCGGTTTLRKEADANLRTCVSQAGHGGQAGIMFFGVRLFGHRLWPFPWRWGYGHAWPYREPDGNSTHANDVRDVTR